MGEELILPSNTANFMPVLSMQDMIARREFLIEATRQVMQEGHDYGLIPGTQKKTLFLPGAQKLCSLYGLTPEFDILKQVEEWEGDALFAYTVKCKLSRGGFLIAEGLASCNSHETKYRYRDAQRVCPECQQPTIFKSKNQGEGYYCWTKRGGCGAKFGAKDSAIEGQAQGKVPNPDIADLPNTLLKMAKKRAFVDATMTAVNASEFFTQDIGDMEVSGYGEEPPASMPARSPQKPVQPTYGAGAANMTRDEYARAEGTWEFVSYYAAVPGQCIVRPVGSNEEGIYVSVEDAVSHYHVNLPLNEDAQNRHNRQMFFARCKELNHAFGKTPEEQEKARAFVAGLLGRDPISIVSRANLTAKDWADATDALNEWHLKSEQDYVQPEYTSPLNEPDPFADDADPEAVAIWKASQGKEQVAA